VGPRWHGYRFDLRGATFGGGDFSAIVVPRGTLLDLGGATLSGGTMDFSRATFSGDTGVIWPDAAAAQLGNACRPRLSSM
jgi:hypothetical protein